MCEEKRVLEKLGGIFYGLRKRKRFSQRGFAKHLGIDRSYYAKVEKGNADISFLMVRRISKGLGIGMGKLFKRIEDHLK